MTRQQSIESPLPLDVSSAGREVGFGELSRAADGRIQTPDVAARPAAGGLRGLLRRRRLLVICGAALAVLAAVGTVAYRWSSGSAASAIKPFTVIRGPMKVVITADGTIRSDKTVDVRSHVWGMVRILEIVPEGTKIEKAGMLLAKLDTSDLENQRDVQEIKVKDVATAATQAEKALEIQLTLNDSDVSQSEQVLEFARIGVDKYEKGDFKQLKQQAESQITLADQTLHLAQDKLQWSQKLAAKGYISGSELTADELAFKKSQLDLELAKTGLEVLQMYTYPQQSAKNRSDWRQAEAALSRAKARAVANEARCRNDLMSRQEAYALEKRQLDKLEQQIVNGAILAPQPGLVVYYSTGRPRWAQQGVIDVGYMVRENEPIISLPDLAVMVADVNVPEAKRTAIEEGQPALVHVGVQPDHPLIGKVKSRGVMPVQQDWWGRGDVQRFQAVVEVPNPPAWLLPGLGCNAEITVKELADVIQVPIQAVFQRDDRQVCYVVDGTRIRCLPVRIGMDDDRMVEIKAGLEVGWKVMLAEPEDAMKIKVESPAFGPARPEPAGAELATVHPTTRPDPATQPEGAAGDPSGTPSEAEIAAIIARMRKAAPELAERLVKMSPDERLRTIVEIRKHLRGPDEHRVTPTTKPQGE